MERKLKHSEIAGIVQGAADAKVLNMDASIRSLIEPAAAVMKHTGDEVALHVVCCNEYGFVTGVTGGLDASELRKDIQSLRVALDQVKQSQGQ